MDFILFFALQFVQYCLITINYRAIAAAKYGWTAATDLIFAALSFTLIKRVAAADSNLALAGYVLGGVIGAQAGIYLSKKLWQTVDKS